jgi:alpha-tubulin suppressor-like RCC1 family protein
LGDGTREDKSKAISIGVSNVVKISGGEHYNLLVKDNGKVYAFGRNNDGQIGDFSTTDRLEIFEVIMDNSRILDICTGITHSVILKANGKLYGFGRNSVRNKFF